jgi:hypothetical protein
MRMYGRMRWNASGVGLIFCFLIFVFTFALHCALWNIGGGEVELRGLMVG